MAEPDIDTSALDERLAAAKTASFELATAPTAKKDAALEAIAAALRANAGAIVAANAEDLAAGRANGLSEGLLDRLALDERRVGVLADAVLEVVQLDDPVGETLAGRSLPSGIRIDQVRVPLGVVG